LVQTWYCGGIASGSSRLHTVTSIHAGLSAVWYVSGVPQVAQKVRVTGGEERKDAGAPCVTRNASRG
jgi:hypothetical protein